MKWRKHRRRFTVLTHHAAWQEVGPGLLIAYADLPVSCRSGPDRVGSKKVLERGRGCVIPLLWVLLVARVPCVAVLRTLV